jgi:hypothetical protein
MKEIMAVVKNKLYGGTIEIVFDSFKHSYSIGSEKIPSVTTVLGATFNKPALVNWSAGMCADYIKESWNPGQSYDEVEIATIVDAGRKAHWEKKKSAGEMGSFVHNFLDHYFKGENPPIPVNKELRESVNKFMQLVEKHSIKVLSSEQVCFSNKYKYVGTLDAIVKMDGKLYILDIKTGKNIYPEFFIQTSAYRYARSEEFPDEKYVGQIILRVGLDGEIEVVVVEDDDWYMEMMRGFAAARRLYATQQKMEKFGAIKL